MGGTLVAQLVAQNGNTMTQRRGRIRQGNLNKMADYRISPDGMTPMIDDENTQAESRAAIPAEETNGGGGDACDSLEEKWGFPLEELYKLCLNFYKGQSVSLFFSRFVRLV